MQFKIPDAVQIILDVLEEHGYDAYIVGGCVRDLILGLEPKDYDICTSALPEDVSKLFLKTVPTGLKHGTVTVIVKDTPFEITTFRIESSYTDHRHPDGVYFSDSLNEDLGRRDFTINAMAFHPKKGIIDPFGGTKDLNNGTIKTVGKPKDRFEEDALRMLRAIRFQSRFGFSIDNETYLAIKSLSENIKVISRERILSEINGILLGFFPEAFDNLLSTGLINHIFQNSFSLINDLKLMTKLPKKLPVRWSFLFWKLELHDIDGIRKICISLKMSNNLKNRIVKISKFLNNPLPYNIFMLRCKLAKYGMDAFKDSLQIMKLLCNNLPNVERIENFIKQIINEKHCIHLSDLDITGKDLMHEGFKPGKQLGDVLNTLFLIVLQKPELNRRDILMVLAKIIRQKILLPKDMASGRMK